jgi:hypothetical protein
MSAAGFRRCAYICRWSTDSGAAKRSIRGHGWRSVVAAITAPKRDKAVRPHCGEGLCRFGRVYSFLSGARDSRGRVGGGISGELLVAPRAQGRPRCTANRPCRASGIAPALTGLSRSHRSLGSECPTIRPDSYWRSISGTTVNTWERPTTERRFCRLYFRSTPLTVLMLCDLARRTATRAQRRELRVQGRRLTKVARSIATCGASRKSHTMRRAPAANRLRQEGAYRQPIQLLFRDLGVASTRAAHSIGASEGPCSNYGAHDTVRPRHTLHELSLAEPIVPFSRQHCTCNECNSNVTFCRKRV